MRKRSAGLWTQFRISSANTCTTFTFGWCGRVGPRPGLGRPDALALPEMIAAPAEALMLVERAGRARHGPESPLTTDVPSTCRTPRSPRGRILHGRGCSSETVAPFCRWRAHERGWVTQLPDRGTRGPPLAVGDSRAAGPRAVVKFEARKHRCDLWSARSSRILTTAWRASTPGRAVLPSDVGRQEDAGRYPPRRGQSRNSAVPRSLFPWYPIRTMWNTRPRRRPGRSAAANSAGV